MKEPSAAALFVETGGVYYGLPGVDLWDEERDARLYAGPWPVVAHPPCARWCMLAPLIESQYGHKVGDDGGSFEAALRAVQTYGGVLEHPAFTKAWPAFDLPRPQFGWWQPTDAGWVTEVWQSAYGMPARKRTWLLYVGPEPAPLDWRKVPGTTTVSDLGPGGSRRRGKDWKPGIQYGPASATPTAFRDVLLGLARSAGGVRAAA